MILPFLQGAHVRTSNRTMKHGKILTHFWTKSLAMERHLKQYPNAYDEGSLGWTECIPGWKCALRTSTSVKDCWKERSNDLSTLWCFCTFILSHPLLCFTFVHIFLGVQSRGQHQWHNHRRLKRSYMKSPIQIRLRQASYHLLLSMFAAQVMAWKCPIPNRPLYHIHSFSIASRLCHGRLKWAMHDSVYDQFDAAVLDKWARRGKKLSHVLATLVPGFMMILS